MVKKYSIFIDIVKKAMKILIKKMRKCRILSKRDGNKAAIKKIKAAIIKVMWILTEIYKSKPHKNIRNIRPLFVIFTNSSIEIRKKLIACAVASRNVNVYRSERLKIPKIKMSNETYKIGNPFKTRAVRPRA